MSKLKGFVKYKLMNLENSQVLHWRVHCNLRLGVLHRRFKASFLKRKYLITFFKMNEFSVFEYKLFENNHLNSCLKNRQIAKCDVISVA